MLVTAAPIIDKDRDDRKTAAIAARRSRPEPNTQAVHGYRQVRAMLRDPTLKQGGGGVEFIDMSKPERAPVFFLDGADHKKKRATIARYFTPRAITSRYHRIIDQITGEQIAALRRNGSGRLDLMSFDLAVAVAADIVGLTESDRARMAKRLALLLSAAFLHQGNYVGRLLLTLRKLVTTIGFYRADVRPAVRDRRVNPQEDVISRLVQDGASGRAIVIECMTYAAAGMVTTREFIVMAAWHFFGNDALRDRFLAGDQDDQFAILLEILRLEPIAAFLYRRTEPDTASSATNFALCLRDANTDVEAVGACPHALDPDRAARVDNNGSYMSFGDGAHHCPGWQVALHETRTFLHALFLVPGIRLERAPDIGWSDMLQSYELRGAVVACDR